jgi:hypothetical protein
MGFVMSEIGVFSIPFRPYRESTLDARGPFNGSAELQLGFVRSAELQLGSVWNAELQLGSVWNAELQLGSVWRTSRSNTIYILI